MHHKERLLLLNFLSAIECVYTKICTTDNDWICILTPYDHLGFLDILIMKVITAHFLKPLNYLRLRLVCANAEPATDLEILL